MAISKSTEKKSVVDIFLSFTTVSFKFGRYLLGVVALPRGRVPQGHAQGHVHDPVDEYQSNGRSEVHLPIGRTAWIESRSQSCGDGSRSAEFPPTLESTV
jgi:hypothetical protein